MATSYKEHACGSACRYPGDLRRGCREAGRDQPVPLIVDVRDGTEVAASGKAKGAIAVARGSLESRADPESPNHNPAFRKDRPVILYCAGGGRAALAGKTLKDMGFSDVRNLGGFKDWVAGGGAVEKV